MKVVLLNVGSNSNEPAGRGPIFEDGSFKFIPISESEREVGNATKIMTYRLLGLSDYVPENIADLPVHNDPDFQKATYGHIKRWSEINSLKALKGGDILLFFATLDFKGNAKKKLPWINENWGAYIVGYFQIAHVMTEKEFNEADEKIRQQFVACPHFGRERRTDLWIKGTEDSKLLKYALPISDSKISDKPNELMRKIFIKGAKHGGWYRRTFVIDTDLDNVEKLLKHFWSFVKK